MTFTCRPATVSDTPALLDVHRAAFSTDVEADLVADLVATVSDSSRLSWVADAEGSVVGHVLLTAGDVAGAPEMSVMLLCPLAVTPSYQHAGVGTALTTTALAAASASGVRVVMVFGDPAYYARFGFESLLPSGPLPAFDVADSQRTAWQTLLLDDDPVTRTALDRARPRWAAPLMRPELWRG